MHGLRLLFDRCMPLGNLSEFQEVRMADVTGVGWLKFPETRLWLWRPGAEHEVRKCAAMSCLVDADRILGCQSVVLCNVMLNSAVWHRAAARLGMCSGCAVSRISKVQGSSRSWAVAGSRLRVDSSTSVYTLINDAAVCGNMHRTKPVAVDTVTGFVPQFM